jgi:protein involved in polysaccharide export with SLBB domain
MRYARVLPHSNLDSRGREFMSGALHVRAARPLTYVVLALALFAAQNSPSAPRDRVAPAAVSEPTEERISPQALFKGRALRGPIDADEYIVGPGDLFAVTIWAQDVTSLTSAVAPEGTIVLPGIATVYVAGETLTDAKALIRDKVASRYRNVEVSIVLEELRKIAVNVLGSVSDPGVYEGTALERASTLIARAGGLADGASRRNIVIARRSGAAQPVDLERYENLGELAANPPILDGDVIFVPYMKSRVFVYGAVSAPGGYERVPTETIGSLIELAGGLADGARPDTVELRTFVSDTKTRSVFVDIRSAEGRSHPVGEHDQVYVRFIPEWRPLEVVYLDGEFVFPGVYGINEGVDRVRDVIDRAGGFTAGAALHETRLVRSTAGDDVDLEYERLTEVTVGDMSEAEYAYFKSRSRERKGAVVVEFEELLSGSEAENVLLRSGDRITAPKIRYSVEVTGQVSRPGRVTYVPKKRASYYIREAGGYAPDAHRGKTKVIRSGTGERLPTARAGALLPGDVIWIPERQEIDWWELVREVAGLATSLATVYIVVNEATKN